MKKIIALFLLISSVGWAQQTKVFNQQLNKAKSEHKKVLLYFSGSDWCAPCIKLDKNIWQSDAFKKEAAQDWIIVRADFPRKKANQLPKDQTEHNRKLAEKFNLEGSFPLVVILDKNGKVLGKMGFKNVSPEEYIKMIHAFEKK